MSNTEQPLRTFFSRYENRMNEALDNPSVFDIDGMVGSFADFFVGANPLGVSGGSNDAQFRTLLPGAIDFYRSIGTTRMNITGLHLTRLDAFHWMAQSDWTAYYELSDGRRDEISFPVIYFVQVRDETPRIFSYITGDEEAAYREHGLIE